MNDDGPSVLAMVGAVALIVALVILLFFAAGYLCGPAAARMTFCAANAGFFRQNV